jgi:hypothetical protein
MVGHHVIGAALLQRPAAASVKIDQSSLVMASTKETAGRKCYRVGRAATGLGLFATAAIAKGEFIVEYSGRRIPTKEAHAREARAGSRYMFEINRRWTIDGAIRTNIGRYANHSCRPNAESALVNNRIFLRAIRTIAPGDEITYDYGREYFDLFIKPVGCRCAKCAADGRGLTYRDRSAAKARHNPGAPSNTSAPSSRSRPRAKGRRQG